MRILIIGAGKMGTFFSDLLCFKHTVGIFDTDPQRLRFTFNTQRMTDPEEIRTFNPNSSSTLLPSSLHSTHSEW